LLFCVEIPEISGNILCNCKGIPNNGIPEMPNKGFTMQEFDIIEVENFDFNHYLHHFEECDGEYIHYNDEYGCIEAATECLEEIIWE
jgi:hypothetical protein